MYVNLHIDLTKPLGAAGHHKAAVPTVSGGDFQ